MRRLLAFFSLIFLVSISACAGSKIDKGTCIKSEELCIKVRAEEPIRNGEPFTLVVTITTHKDIPELQVSITSFPPVLIEGPVGWEERGLNIAIDAKENNSYIYIRKVLLPDIEGVYGLIVGAYTPTLPYLTDSIRIHLTNLGGKVYLSGTSIPITEGPMPTMNPDELATARALPTYTVYPTVTPVPVTEVLPLEILSGTAYPGPGTPYP